MLIGGEGHYRNSDNYKYPKHVNEVVLFIVCSIVY